MKLDDITIKEFIEDMENAGYEIWCPASNKTITIAKYIKIYLKYKERINEK